MTIDPLEALYLVVNLAALVLTTSALIDARADATAVKLLNGRARELAAQGNVRRELLRIVMLLLLLTIVWPGLFDDDPVSLSPLVVALMAIPIVILVSTALDARDRRAMTVIVTADLLHTSEATLSRLEGKVDEIRDATVPHLEAGPWPNVDNLRE